MELVKQVKIITKQSESKESPEDADRISVTIEHRKTFQKLSKTIRQRKNVIKSSSC